MGRHVAAHVALPTIKKLVHIRFHEIEDNVQLGHTFVHAREVADAPHHVVVRRAPRGLAEHQIVHRGLRLQVLPLDGHQGISASIAGDPDPRKLPLAKRGEARCHPLVDELVEGINVVGAERGHSRGRARAEEAITSCRARGGG